MMHNFNIINCKTFLGNLEKPLTRFWGDQGQQKWGCVLSYCSKKGQNVQIFHNQVRFYRKPKWVPRAQSKLYRIIQKEFRNPGLREDEVVGPLKSYCRSIWLWQDKLLEGQRLMEYETDDISEEIGLRRIVDMESQKVTVRVKSQRDKQLVEEWVATVREIGLLRDSFKTEDDIRLEEATQEVLAHMERLKTSISLEDLDEALDKAGSAKWSTVSLSVPLDV